VDLISPAAERGLGVALDQEQAAFCLSLEPTTAWSQHDLHLAGFAGLCLRSVCEQSENIPAQRCLGCIGR
jgi:hypothetical protein